MPAHEGSTDPRAVDSEIALRELPEALILVFDEELRFVLSAGQALARGGSASASFRAGQLIAEAFPADLWRLMEPLCHSALQGETRSRELWTTDGRHGLMVDIGPLRPGGPIGDARGPDATGLGERTGRAGGTTGRDGATAGVAVVLDVSARRRETPPARHPREHLDLVFDHAPIGMGLLDPDGRWVLVNHALCDITGYTAAELVGRRFHDIAHPQDAANDVTQRRQLLGGEIAAFQVEKRYFNAAGETMSALLAISLVRNRDGTPLHYIVQLQDISERKLLEERLRHLADHDPLTGLRNRRLFEYDLELQVGRCQRYGEQAALMLIDLDDFKHVNDCHGHHVGDDALRTIARTLTRRLRTTDLVARLGGDEFAVLLPHMDRPGAERVAADLTRVIATCTVDAGDAVLHLTGSIGFTLIDRQARDDEQILVEADRAMYAAKRAKALAVQVP
jgi:diguanylate cyclase (GGDEF)-like protein/PAS domain S-box-containing protein